MYKYQQAMLNAYESATCDSIFKAYARPSNRKVSIFTGIESGMRTVSGFGLKVTGHNSNFFSCGYLYPDQETGALRLAYFTPSRSYDFEI